MTIGVDAGMLSAGDERLQVGVWRVAYNLLKELGKLDDNNSYRLYSFAPIPKNILQEFGPQMENRVLRPKKGWFTLRVPIELQVSPVDVFLGLAQALPAGPARKIGFVYDIGFMHYPESYPGSADRLERQTKELVTRADHIVTISHASKNDMVKYFKVDPAKITVGYLGVDERFTPKNKHTARPPYFLFVGSLKKGKNIPMLIEAFSQFLKKSKKTYDLLVIGSDYWLDPEIKQTIFEEKLSERVHLLGFVPDKKMPQYYKNAVAFVSPSLVEGFCLPAAEAMACGTQVIVSDIPAMKEVVGKGGIFVDPHDADELADAMGIVADRVNNAGTIQAKKYTWERFAEIVYHAIML